MTSLTNHKPYFVMSAATLVGLRHTKLNSRLVAKVSFRVAHDEIKYINICYSLAGRLACGEQTHFSAFVSPAEKIAIFSAGETKAEKCVCSPQGTGRSVLQETEPKVLSTASGGTQERGRLTQNNYLSTVKVVP